MKQSVYIFIWYWALGCKNYWNCCQFLCAQWCLAVFINCTWTWTGWQKFLFNGFSSGSSACSVYKTMPIICFFFLLLFLNVSRVQCTLYMYMHSYVTWIMPIYDSSPSYRTEMERPQSKKRAWPLPLIPPLTCCHVNHISSITLK